MNLNSEDFSIIFNEEKNTVIFTGSLRLLNLKEYDQIKDILEGAYKKIQGTLILDLKRLKFLNSSGITTLSVFVISARKQNGARLKVLGDNNISWQEKSLMNLQKLWDDVEILI